MKLWVSVHKWSSLIATLFLLVSCLTGLPLIFSDELRAEPPVATRSPSSERTPSLEQVVTHAQGLMPRRFVQFVFWEEEADRLGLGVSSVVDAPLDQVDRVMVDARTGALLGSVPAEPALMAALLTLHKNLYLGDAGLVLFAVVALLFLASTVSGVVLYGPFMRRTAFGSVRSHSPRLRWLDLHNLVGISTTVWVLLVAATGFMNTLETALFAAWQEAKLPALLATDSQGATSLESASLDVAVASAQRALPQMQMASIGLAGTRYGTPRHHLAWMHGKTRLTRRIFTPILVERGSGAVALAEPLPWYLRLLEVSRPLHFGDYGGLPLKAVWAAFDVGAIFVLGTGVYLWRVKWR